MVKKSLMIVGGCAAAMIAAAALAGTGSLSFLAAKSAGAPARPTTAAAADPSIKEARAVVVASGYGPVPALFNAAPLGQGQTSLSAPVFAPLVRVAAPTSDGAVNISARQPLDDGSTALIATATPDRFGCTLNANGQRVGVSLDVLVNAIKADLARLNAQTPVDTVRALVQEELNRSGDDVKLKSAAIDLLKASYSSQTLAGQALARPFNLYDNGLANVPGYDPCGNPAATGGSAFGGGPFASDFATINPVPVVASRLSAAAEGGI